MDMHWRLIFDIIMGLTVTCVDLHWKMFLGYWLIHPLLFIYMFHLMLPLEDMLEVCDSLESPEICVVMCFDTFYIMECTTINVIGLSG